MVRTDGCARPQDRQFRVTVAIATEETATTPSTVVWPFVKWPKLGDRQLTVRELLANNSIYNAGGRTLIRNQSTLKSQGVLVSAGELQTYGAGTATLSKDDGFSGNLLTFTGGTLTISADGQAQYGTLAVNGNMSWTGGTYEAYVVTGASTSKTTLAVQGNLNTTAGGHIHVSGIPLVFGVGESWDIVTFGSTTGTQLTFDNGGSWSLAIVGSAYRVTYTP